MAVMTIMKLFFFWPTIISFKCWFCSKNWGKQTGRSLHAKELFQKKLHGKHSWNASGLFRVENSKSNHEQKQSITTMLNIQLLMIALYSLLQLALNNKWLITTPCSFSEKGQKKAKKSEKLKIWAKIYQI